MDFMALVDPKTPEHVTIQHDPARFYCRANELRDFATSEQLKQIACE
jgi:hypothetical protein